MSEESAHPFDIAAAYPTAATEPLPQHRYPCPDCGALAGEPCRPYMRGRDIIVHARRPVPVEVTPAAAYGADFVALALPPEPPGLGPCPACSAPYGADFIALTPLPAPPGSLSPHVAYNTMRVGIDALRLAAEAPTPYARLLMAMALAMAACDARTPGDGTLWRIKQGLCDAIEAYDRDIRA